MDVYGLTVEVIKGDIMDIEDQCRIADLQVRPEENTVRDTVRRGLVAAEQSGCKTVFLGPVGVDSGFPAVASAKIIAQEISRYARCRGRNGLNLIRCLLSNKDRCAIFETQVLGYLRHMIDVLGRGPYCTVDGIVEMEKGIVLVERRNPPFGWALPGGFVDYGESLETAVQREIKEETGLEYRDLNQFRVYSDPDRDPRFHTISAVFTGKGQGTLRAGDDAARAEVFFLQDLPENIAFDHRQIIEDYKQATGNR